MITPTGFDSFEIYLIRHPQTDWNAARRYQGLTDRPWSSAGAARAVQIIEKYASSPSYSTLIPATTSAAAATPPAHTVTNPNNLLFDTVLSSPRSHTRQLAEKLALEVIEDARWSEIDHGNWEGLTYEEVCQQFPDTVDERFSDPLHSRSHGGQSLQDINLQVTEGWHHLLKQQNTGRTAIVTHATPIQLILCLITGLPIEQYWQFRIDCGSIISLDITQGGPIINFRNQL